MQQKSLDGIRAARRAVPQKITYITPLLTPAPHAKPRKKTLWQKGTILTASLLTIFLGAGLFSHATIADSPTIITTSQVQLSSNNPAQAFSALLNTSLALLPEYRSVTENDQKISERKNKLSAFLVARNSPFAEDEVLDTIVRQEHWKLILAIANAESSLGKRCADQNCSGIGVAPGTPTWRKYKSIKNWVLDLNRLLEKRYSNSTLTDMCGIYVQPCNPNWLLATTQIINELNQQGIE